MSEIAQAGIAVLIPLLVMIVLSIYGIYMERKDE